MATMHSLTIIKVFLFVFTLINVSDGRRKMRNNVIADDDCETSVPIQSNSDEDCDYEDESKIEKVDIEIYYESMCPFSRKIYSKKVGPLARKLEGYLNIYSNPYGDATTKFEGNKFKFSCQHGPRECLGNMLHACALNVLGNHTAVQYIACLMDKARKNRGSDDNAADVCADLLDVDGDSIKKCAHRSQGARLLAAYGKVIDKVDFEYVPWILINGKLSESQGSDLFEEVCAAFKKYPKPEPCMTKTRRVVGGIQGKMDTPDELRKNVCMRKKQHLEEK